MRKQDSAWGEPEAKILSTSAGHGAVDEAGDIGVDKWHWAVRPPCEDRSQCTASAPHGQELWSVDAETGKPCTHPRMKNTQDETIFPFARKRGNAERAKPSRCISVFCLRVREGSASTLSIFLLQVCLAFRGLLATCDNKNAHEKVWRCNHAQQLLLCSCCTGSLAWVVAGACSCNRCGEAVRHCEPTSRVTPIQCQSIHTQ
eukprot:4647418-Amphidinium_carterae.1